MHSHEMNYLNWYCRAYRITLNNYIYINEDMYAGSSIHSRDMHIESNVSKLYFQLFKIARISSLFINLVTVIATKSLSGHFGLCTSVQATNSHVRL